MSWGEIGVALVALCLIVTGRYLLFSGGAYLTLFRWKREAWRSRKIQPAWPDAAVLRQELGWSLLSNLVFAAAGVVLLVLWRGGHARLYTRLDEHGLAWLPLSVLLVLALHETYFYWTHRWMHRPRVFRRMHRVHHLSRNPSPWAAFAFHPLEALLQAAFLPLIVLIVPLHVGALLAYLMIMTALSVINHAGYEFYPAGFARHRLGRWIISSTHHNLHHSRMRTNFGLYFTVWDRLLGTEDPVYPETYAAVIERRGG